MITKTLDVQDLRQRVQQMYREVAEHPNHAFHFETGRALAERLGYPAADLDSIPSAAIESFAGVGYFFDLADIRAGSTVVDLGSGSGTDSFLAARQVGATGHAIGVDLTPAQLAKAEHLAAITGTTNVEFRHGQIEELPINDGIADVVISNGVINLVPDKHVAFHAAARVLRPGGRIALADIVTDSHLPSSVSCDAALWAACIGGAMQRDDYFDAITSAGFQIEIVRPNTAYEFLSESAVKATGRWGVRSISLLARRV